jgi:hypothetical protein
LIPDYREILKIGQLQAEPNFNFRIPIVSPQARGKILKRSKDKTGKLNKTDFNHH